MEANTGTEQNPTNWIPPVLPTVATTGEGIRDLIIELGIHLDYLKTTGVWKEREQARLQNQLENLLSASLRTHWENRISQDTYQDTLARVINRNLSPWEAVEELILGAGL